MDNRELVRWEMKDRAAAHQRIEGQRRYALQINHQVKERAAAHQRMVADARPAAELDASKPSVRGLQFVLPLLIGFVCVFLWLVAW